MIVYLCYRLYWNGCEDCDDVRTVDMVFSAEAAAESWAEHHNQVVDHLAKDHALPQGCRRLWYEYEAREVEEPLTHDLNQL
jgi:hypothetical protein